MAQSSTMDRKQKLRRLNDWRRELPHCTASALSAIVAAVKDRGIPELGTNRNTFREARNVQCNDGTPAGPIIQRITLIAKEEGDEVKPFTVAHPLAALWQACRDCEPFKHFMRDRMREHPCSHDAPWRIITYSDEVTPGNVVAVVNNRKFHAIYWSFQEFGFNALSREESWFCIATELSIHMNTYAAGLSQAFAALILLFFDPDGIDISTAGLNLPIGDGIRIWAVVSGVLQDGGAHKSVWHHRGDGASRFCFLCKNLFTHESMVCDEDGTKLLTCRCTKHDQLVKYTAAEVRTTARYVASQAGIMEPEPFKELQMGLGVTYHAWSILLNRKLDRILDPIKAYMHDPMHCLFVDGICNLALFLLLESCIQAGFVNVYTVLSEYLAKWTLQSRISGADLPDIFSEGRRDKHRKAKHIKCQASDMLSMMPIVTLFATNVVLHLGINIADECNAWLALADLVDIVIASARITITPDKLRAAAEIFLQTFVTAWGFDWMTPKFPWLLHFGDILELFKFLS